MFNFIKKMFCKKGKPMVVDVVLTQEQDNDRNHYDRSEWPKPVSPGLNDLVWFGATDGNFLTGVVKAIKREHDAKVVEYQVVYNTDSKRKFKADALFKTRTDAIRAAIGKHWQEIQRLYTGLLTAKRVPSTVIDYTTTTVQAHKNMIAFLESQLGKEA